MESRTTAALDLNTHYHREANVCELFVEAAVSFPEKAALTGEEGIASYVDLLNYAQNLAAMLVTRHGVRAGSVVGLAAGRSFATVGSILGIMMAGAAYLPLDVANSPASLLARQLAESGVRIVLGDEKNTEASCAQWWGGATVVPIPEVSHLLMPLAQHAALPRARATDPAYIMFTSGSTGAPKGVRVPHRGVVRLVSAQHYMQFGPQHTWLLHSPLGFDASCLELWGALLHGGTLAVAPDRPLSIEDYRALIARHHVSSLWMTAAVFHLAAEHAPEIFQPLKQLAAGGDVISPRHVVRVRNVCPELAITNGYGPTESTTFAVCYRVPRPYIEQPALPIGHVIAHTSAYVLDEALRPVNAGETGELYLGGDGLALGYINQPELTAERFLSDPFSDEPGARMYRTGDRVRRDADGLIHFQGRADREQKIGGHRVDLEELERLLSAHPAVRAAAVLTLKPAEGEKQIYAAVEVAQPEQVPGLGEMLRGHLEEQLPKWALPAELFFLPQLPVNANGKLDRSAIQQQVAARIEERRGRSVASTEHEQDTLHAVLALWSMLLQREIDDAGENFFDAGGDSLLLIQMHAHLSREYPGAVELMDLFEATTPGRLSKLIDQRLAAMPQRKAV